MIEREFGGWQVHSPSDALNVVGDVAVLRVVGDALVEEIDRMADDLAESATERRCTDADEFMVEVVNEVADVAVRLGLALGSAAYGAGSLEEWVRRAIVLAGLQDYKPRSKWVTAKAIVPAEVLSWRLDYPGTDEQLLKLRPAFDPEKRN